MLQSRRLVEMLRRWANRIVLRPDGSDAVAPLRRCDIFPRQYPSRLEPRIVLNGLPVVPVEAAVAVDAGAAAGDGSPDTFDVRVSDVDSGMIQIAVNGEVVQEVQADQVSSIQISGSADSDQLNVDAEVLQQLTVHFDAGTGGQDGLYISGADGHWHRVAVDLHAAGGQLTLTRADGVVAAGLSFTGTVDVVDSLAVSDRSVTLAEATTSVLSGVDGGLQLQWDSGSMSWGDADPATLAIDAGNGRLELSGSIDVAALNLSARQVEVTGELAVHDGSLLIFASDSLRIDEPASLAVAGGDAHLQTHQISLDGTLRVLDGGAFHAIADSEGSLTISGKIDVSDASGGASGGTVNMRGGTIEILDSARIDASGDVGGGTIFVGGELQGAPSSWPNASRVIIHQGALIAADALASGDGGTLIVWSDDATYMAGQLSARGGALAGDGGFIEVSSRSRLWMRGHADTAAPLGNAGTLLLDPETITIIAGDDGDGDLDGQLTVPPLNEILAGEPDQPANTVTVGALAALGANANIVLQAEKTITVDLQGAPFELDLSGGSITLHVTDVVDGSIIFVGSNDALQTLGGDITLIAATIELAGGTFDSGAAGMSLQGNVVLNDNTSLRSGGGNINVTGTVDSDHLAMNSLTLDAGTGNIDLQAAIGSSALAELGQLTVTSASTVRMGGDVATAGAQAITAGTIQTNGTHTTTNAAINFHGNVELQNHTTLFTLGGQIEISSVTGGNNNLTLVSSGGSTTISGAATGLGVLTLQQDDTGSSGAVSMQGNLAAASLVTFDQAYAVSLTGATTTMTAAVIFENSGGVTLGNDSGDTLTFSGGLSSTASTTTLHGSVITAGTDATFGAVTLGGDSLVSTGSGAGNILIDSIDGGDQDLQLISGSGTTTVSGAASDLGVLTLQQDDTASSGAVSMQGNLAVASLVTFDQAYAVSLTGATTTMTAAVIFENSGGVTLGNDSGDTLTFSGGLSSTASTTTLHGSVITAGTDATFGAVTLGGDSLVSTGSGAGNILIDSIDGGDQDLQLISGSGTTTVSGAADDLGDLTIQSASDVTFAEVTAENLAVQSASGTTTLGGAVTLSGDLAWSGGTLTVTEVVEVDGSLTVNNSGVFSTTASAPITADGGFAQTGSGDNVLTSGITTAGASISFASAVTLAGDVAVGSGAGGGNISFGATVDSSGDGNVASDFHQLTLDAGTGSVNLGAAGGGAADGALGDVTILSASDVTFVEVTAENLIVQGTSGTTTLGGTVTLSGNLAFTGVNVTINAPVDADSVTVTNAGLLVTSSAGNIHANDGFTQNGTGSSRLAGEITTVGTDIQFATAVVLDGDVAMGTGTAGGDISFDGTIDSSGDGTTSNFHNLTIAAGTGNVVFGGAVGSSADGALGELTILSASDLTFAEVAAENLTVQASSGTATLGGLVTLGGDLVLSGNVVSVDAGVQTAGSVTVTNTGLLTTNAGVNIAADGGFTQAGTGNNHLGGSITSDGTDINFATAVDLVEDVSLSSGTDGGDITLSQTVDGPHQLQLTAGSGDIALAGAIGQLTPLASLTVVSATVTVVGGNVTTSGAQSVTSTTIRTGGTQRTGAAAITINGNLELEASLTLDTTSGLGEILVDGSISGNGDDLQLLSGTGTTTVTGSAAGLATVTLQEDQATSTGTVRFESGLQAAALVTFSQPYTVRLLGGPTTIGGAVELMNLGLVVLGGDQSDLLTFTGGVTRTAGATALHGQILTADQPAVFATIVLNGHAVIDTGGGGGDIELSGLVDGTQALAVRAGDGDVQITADMGSTAALEQLTIRGRNIAMESPAVVRTTAGIDVVAAGTLSVHHNVLSLAGNLNFEAHGGDLTFSHPVAGTVVNIETQGASSEIVSIAAGEIILDPDVVVLFQTPTTQYFNIRPELTVAPQDALGLPGVQVDLDGNTVLHVDFGATVGLAEKYFELTVDWGDGLVKQYSTATVEGGGVQSLQRAEVGDTLVFVLQHQYFENPNPNDPNAPIPVTVTARNAGPSDTAANILFFADGDTSTPLSTQGDLMLQVPVSGLIAPPVILRSDPVLVLVIQPPDVIVAEPVVQAAFNGTQATPPMTTVFESPPSYERYYVLRIVIEVDEQGNTRELEDIRIDPSYLRNLPELFRLLPDDRYRLYLIREDGVAQMVTDVIVRGGQSVGSTEVLDDDFERGDAEAEQHPATDEATDEATGQDAEPAVGPDAEDGAGATLPRGSLWRLDRGPWLITKSGPVTIARAETTADQAERADRASVRDPLDASTIAGDLRAARRGVAAAPAWSPPSVRID